MQEIPSRAWVEIDLGALRRNGAALRALSGVPLLPMVKADAYGLGAVAVARALEQIEPWGFGVASVFEGEELRRGGIGRPIIVFTPLLAEELDGAAKWELTPALGSAATIAEWGATGRPWHLAIDTGMARAGIDWRSLASIKQELRRFPPAGAFTHYHSAQIDDGSMQLQERRFAESLSMLHERPDFVHAEGSAGIVRHQPSPYSLVRPGIFLYGVGSGQDAVRQPEAVVHMRARIVDMRDLEAGDSVSYDATFVAQASMKVATLAIGYADGYPRSLSGSGQVLVNGETVDVIGRVTMDMTMIDVTGRQCGVGDTATLIGRDGTALLTVERVAETAGMSPYELLTGLRGRILRQYIQE